jgi:(2R)-3-sulfolactate dehydrogenase (NADP+)
VIDSAALAGGDVFHERIETLVAAMLADEDVRLPGARRHALARCAGEEGIEVPAVLLEQLESLARGG